MKVGIMTFFSANNYGAILQAFSLQKKVEELCGSCECIDYKCPAIEAVHSPRSLSPKNGIKGNLKNLARNAFYAPRVWIFSAFRDRVAHSRPYTRETIAEANGDYDVFITGSDQVFNLKLTGGDESYFLDFVNGEGRRVAYAASMGPFLEDKKESYERLLKGFDLLSVRESSTAEELHDKLGIACEVVPDPVFLHDAEEWKTLLEIREETAAGKYVLIYTLFESPELYRLAASYAKENGCRVWAVTKALRHGGKADRFLRKVDPAQFVALIANAAYVVTDSFHGTAFSLLFGKQHHIVMPPNARNRIDDLLSALELSPEASEIDYEALAPRLKAYRQKGTDFLMRLTAR